MNQLHNCLSGYLGYFASLGDFLAHYDEGGEPGSFFLNGETSSLWMWNPVTATWCDSNYRTAPELVSLITDPETFSPNIAPNRESLFYFVASSAGTYNFPALKNTYGRIRVECTEPSIVLLQWNGSTWTTYTYPINFVPSVSYIYKGLWQTEETYLRSNTSSDVVLYDGLYYCPITIGVFSGDNPKISPFWEELPSFAALAGGLQVVEENGKGILTISPNMCSLIVKAPDGSELVHMAISEDNDAEYSVRQRFYTVSNGVAYATSITPKGIVIAEGTPGELGMLITKQCSISAKGLVHI